MHALSLTTSVAARPQRVWATVADFEGYPAWHPLVHWIRVRTEWSTRLTARLRIKRTIRLSGSLIEHDPPNLISWDGSHRIWGLLRVRYTLRISPAAGGSEVTQAVRVTGWLPRLVPGALSSMPDALAETAHALKRESEREPTVRLAA